MWYAVSLTDGPAWVDNHRSSGKELKLLPQRDKVSIFASFEIFEFPVVEEEFQMALKKFMAIEKLAKGG